MPARSEDARFNTVMRQICFIGRQRTRSRTSSGCNDTIARYFRRRSRNINIRRRSAIARIFLRNFRAGSCAGMSSRAGGELSRAIAFRNNHRTTGRDGLGIEHQHLAQRFFSRGISASHRRRRRHSHCV